MESREIAEAIDRGSKLIAKELSELSWLLILIFGLIVAARACG